MEFQTTFSIEPSSFSIDHTCKIISIGSCFADHIGNYLVDHKFPILSNPFGVIFNPISIVELLKMTQSQTFSSNLITEHQGIFHHFSFHSNLSALSKKKLELQLTNKIKEVLSFLNTTDTLIITLGTAFVYEHLNHNMIVANCHKVPQKKFRKRLVTVDEIIHAFRNIKTLLNQFKQVIITVSPVRHLKDSIPLNSVSKSTLRLACHQLCEQFDNFYYFPSYEILMDELRDYRFFKEDMIHPNEIAQKYVWEKFQDAFFSEETKKDVQTIHKLKQASLHKPFHVKSDAHQKFIKNTLSKIETLEKEFDFTEEINSLKQQLL